MQIDWTFWLTDVSFRLLWWDASASAALLVPRLCVFIAQAIAITVAAIFTARCWERWQGPVTIEWDSR